ncbi:cupin domain-containing protein [Rhodobacterales bacterium HKCCE3408]|nr:cupin domain-containing protein [Rhodobacterales bacterium HKCCE3408]
MKDLQHSDTSIEWLGVRYDTILTTEATNGAMSITDTFAPVDAGPPRHIHYDADETFVVLTGEVLIWLDGETFTLSAGQSGFIPRGVEHTYKVISPEGARKLVILTPGGFEGFFADMAAGQFRIPADMGPIEESAKRHHLAFTGPPL